MRYKKDFKANFLLAYPIILGQIGQVMVNIIDNIMVGKLGKFDLAAVALANSVLIALVVLGMGLSFALPPLISEAVGKDNHKAISKYFKHSFIINILFSVIAIVAIEAIIPMMQYWKQDPIVLQKAIVYLRISAYAFIPFMVFQSFRCFSDGYSATHPPMYAMLVGNVINIILNYLLIYGKFGAPQLGIAGAAWGTFISRIVTMVLLIAIIRNYKNLWTDIQHANFKVFQKSIFKKLLKLGVPTSMQGFFEVTAFGVASIFAGMISPATQAAHQVAINLASISFLVCTGIAMAATIRIGNKVGENNNLGARSAGFSAIMMVTVFMCCTSLFFILGRYFFPSIYVDMSKDGAEEVVKIASSLLIFASLFQIPDGIQVTSIGALRGLQDVLVPSIYTIVAYWVLAIPIAYGLAFYTPLGAKGIWLGLTIGLTCSAILMTLRFHNKTK